MVWCGVVFFERNHIFKNTFKTLYAFHKRRTTTNQLHSNVRCGARDAFYTPSAGRRRVQRFDPDYRSSYTAAAATAPAAACPFVRRRRRGTTHASESGGDAIAVAVGRRRAQCVSAAAAVAFCAARANRRKTEE